MTAGRIAAGALALVALGVVLVVLADKPSPYMLNVQLSSANGLRNGSPVRSNGVDVGKVSELKLDKTDHPVAVLKLKGDEPAARVGPGTTAKITTSNLIGAKLLELRPTKGDLPSGSTIPMRRVTEAVDLDKVLDVLDADTRARLQILLNEAGVAVTGRKADFATTLRDLPPDLDQTRTLLAQVTSDNHSLGETVDQSSRFVSRVVRQRRDLSRLVGDAGNTAEAVSAKRQQLAATLDKAPATLVSAQRFLGDLRRTTVPLGPAARTIRDTAPEVTRTLSALPAFQRAADPALQKAITVAPSVTRLANGATPVLRRANPTLRSLSTFSTALKPVSKTLDVSIDDTMGLLEGWSRAIQNRDGVGHLFRGKATISPDVLRAAINAPGLSSTPGLLSKKQTGSSPLPSTKPGANTPAPGGSTTAPAAPQAPASPKDAQHVLDYLLGK